MSAFIIAIRSLLLLFITVLSIHTLSRIGLLILYHNGITQTDAIGFVLTQGLGFNMVLVGALILVPILVFPLLATSRFMIVGWRTLMLVWVPIASMCVLFMELTTVPFANQFDVRPNVLFFEYVNHPKELLATLWGAYRIPLTLGLSFTLVVGFTQKKQQAHLWIHGVWGDAL